MKSIAIWLLATLMMLGPVHAEVTALEIVERGPAFGDAAFGTVGSYERYPTLDSYAGAVRRTALRLAEERLLLPADVDALVERALTEQ